MPIKINQLPVSANSWQHGLGLSFATFSKLKITKLCKTQQPMKLEKNKLRFGIFEILDFLMHA